MEYNLGTLLILISGYVVGRVIEVAIIGLINTGLFKSNTNRGKK